MTTTTNPFPDVEAPAGAVEVTEWCDLEHPGDTFRTFNGGKRGGGPNFVAAYGVQEPDGSISELCVRAEVRQFFICHHEYWDTILSAVEARAKADQLRQEASNLTRLAEAFELAADEVDGWAKR